jgi:LCP family protein required for cell wall assembly
MTEPPPPVGGTLKPPPSGDHEPPPKPKRYWWRFTLASVVIVAAIGAATAASVLLYLDDIATALSHNNAYSRLERYLAQVDGGEPENILILGSDRRAGDAEDPGRSDTAMLLRLDPDNDAIALMSIPRDLKVEIPGYGTDKFNAAYAYGGPKLVLRVIKDLTGMPINHIVNVDYLGFVQAVYAIGCVYIDIDRRYYHSNIGVPAAEQYAEIDVEPGYQLMCGRKALEYVRYRHTDTDLVRAARQQDFLSAARQRVPISKLVGERNELIDIFTTYTTSDIDDAKTMLQVLELFIASRNAAIREVRFPAELGPSFVTASPSAIQDAVNQFQGIEASGGPRGSLDEGDRAAGKRKSALGARARARAKRKAERKAKQNLVKAKPPGDDGLVPAKDAGTLEAKAVARKVGSGFPVFYPTRLPFGAAYEESSTYNRIEDPRVYHLRDTSGGRHGAYRMVVQLSLPDGNHYFGVQGIRGWPDPPILANPSLTRTIKGREYDIYVDGDRVKMVAWRRGDNAYWVTNSLLQVLTNDQMVGIARSARVIVPNEKPRQRRVRR